MIERKDYLLLPEIPSPSNPPARTLLGLPYRIGLVYVVIFTLAFGAYVVLWDNAAVVHQDTIQYFKIGQDWADMRLDTLHMRAPGYAFLLLATAYSPEHNRPLFFVSLLLHFASVWLAAIILHQVGSGSYALLLFGGILSLPLFVEPAAFVMSENLTQFTLSLGFTLLILGVLRQKLLWLGVGALSFGYAGLTRPTYQLLFIVLVGCLFLAAGVFRPTWLKLRQAALVSTILVAGTALVVGGYASLNYSQFGYFGISPMVGIGLSTRTAKVVEQLPGKYEPLRSKLVEIRNRDLIQGRSHASYLYIIRAVPDIIKITGIKEVDKLDRYLVEMNLILIRRAPLNYVTEALDGMLVCWAPALSNLFWGAQSAEAQLGWALVWLVIVALFFAQNIAIGGWLMLQLTRWWVRRETRVPIPVGSSMALSLWVYLVAGAIVFYTVLISGMLSPGGSRLRTPVDFLIILMCVVGAQIWWQLIHTEAEPPA